MREASVACGGETEGGGSGTGGGTGVRGYGVTSTEYMRKVQYKVNDSR